MKTVTFDSPEKGLITYSDKKRYMWLVGVCYPLYPFLGFYLHYLTGNELTLFIPLLLVYLGLPMLDWLLGEDLSNPPEEVVPQLEQDKYYQYLLYFTAPLHLLTFAGGVYWIATQDLSIWAYVLVAVTVGIASGLGINTAHELGHKSDKTDRWFSKMVLGVCGYGHFNIEHVAGHHRYVATPEDTASAKMGENIYQFAMREIPGGIKRAWKIEINRLERQGKSFWHKDNEILHSYAITAILQIGALLIVGWIVLPFLLIHNFFSWWQLTSANYIEHYGLLRDKKENGKYERCQPHHSWNSNHVFSNLLLYHLERHSDHHAHPTRRYQSLRHFENVPELPNGYFGCFLLSYFPPLWFKAMDKRLLQLKHIQGDLNKINMHEPKREKIKKKYASLITA